MHAQSRTLSTPLCLLFDALKLGILRAYLEFLFCLWQMFFITTRHILREVTEKEIPLSNLCMWAGVQSSNSLYCAVKMFSILGPIYKYKELINISAIYEMYILLIPKRGK